MSTLADIRRAAETNVHTCVDRDCPDGHFAATTKILGVTGTYLLAGELDDPQAAIVGRIEYEAPGGVLLPSHRAYVGGGLKGGQWLASYDTEDAFLKMTERSTT